MIIASGVDIVACHRFDHLTHNADEPLLALFTDQEKAYCLENKLHASQRFAARFTAKEACFKALCGLFPSETFQLKRVMQAVEVIKLADGRPQLSIDWARLGKEEPKNLSISVSLSHERDYAVAFVILAVKSAT